MKISINSKKSQKLKEKYFILIHFSINGKTPHR